jgi:hypothetical protein
MPKLSEVFPSKYLKADDIPEEGLVLTISGVEMEELGQGRDKETKPVLSFKEEEKGMVCNKTNCNTIHKLSGSDDTDDWVGHKIRLITLEVDFQGTMTNSIRVSTKPVKAPTPAKKAAPAQESPDDAAANEGEGSVPF